MRIKLYIIGLLFLLLIGGYILYPSDKTTQVMRIIGTEDEISFSEEDIASCQYEEKIDVTYFTLNDTHRKAFAQFTMRNRVIDIMVGDTIFNKGTQIVEPIRGGTFGVYGKPEQFHRFINPMKCNIDNE